MATFQTDLEIRDEGDGSRRLSASFPYNSNAVIDAGGNGRRPRKGRFAPGAFSFAINDPGRDVHLLVGHSFDKPLASKNAGTLAFRDSDKALALEATITAELQEASWWRDFAAAYAAGLIGGISPGFRIAPSDIVPGAEKTEDESPSQGKALIRTIFATILFEMSLVTRPAYPETGVAVREVSERGRVNWRWK